MGIVDAIGFWVSSFGIHLNFASDAKVKILSFIHFNSKSVSPTPSILPISNGFE